MSIEANEAMPSDGVHVGVEGHTRLLVIDDDLVQRRIIAKIGKQAGHTVLEADSVDAATAILERELVHCVTIDLSLGSRSGVEVIAALAKGTRNIPVLIISGMPDNVLQSTTRYAEHCDLIVHATFPKPLDLSRLRSSLADVHRLCGVVAPIEF